MSLLLMLLFLPGCETLNDAMIRYTLKEPGLSGRISDQIREGLKKREQAPPTARPQETPPPFMDQG
ncbi:hypothetical protein KOM00_07605 [Geomonas sp. Red69]|uniref:Lipoprotein n=1 Tax=Geomonas diazotrophica TaxID=2843197 RepID=A0ABX8JT43_9BACT|nr:MULTISPECIES: hypothetical protein [Geomonas]MBU5636600.1 hypothetical protein [Geomonas diazotrophica]QWV98580.1 hypothetical protein KP005_04630 [Geomonas nitrogeniifigens]QXE87763.1 hypothetical protein KP003_04990 [Geomonas nitrogeniifigens]